jgi:hypothetical protein
VCFFRRKLHIEELHNSKYHYDDQVKEYKFEETCSTHAEMTNAYKTFYWKS